MRRPGWILLIFSLALGAQAQVVSFEKVRGLLLKGDAKAALQEIQSTKAKAKPQEQALASFVEGVLLFESRDFAQAKGALQKALSEKTDFESYIHYYLGLTEQALGALPSARKNFEKAATGDIARELAMDIRFHVSEIDLQEKGYTQARQHLQYLEKKWRRSDQYPHILWRLMQVESRTQRRNEVCRWARKLYVSFPEHPLVYDWSIDLQNASFEGQRLGCVATSKDQGKRIRRLQWAGESERARREIDVLRSRAPKSSTENVDTMLATFQINEGLVEEALRLLLPHYEKQKSNVSYLTLLGRAAARAGEYQTAVGALARAHQLSPRSKAGREALFQAASLSYQFQDYDGAMVKFDQFVDQYSRSGLSRDARWHLAWIRYLKGDFKGAQQSFAAAVTEKRRVGRRKWRTVRNERIAYWLAMSQLRQQNLSEARKSFENVILHDPYGYYARAAQARLKTLPASDVPMRLPAQVDAPTIPDGPPPAGPVLPVEVGAPNTEEMAAAAEANESEETLAAQPVGEEDAEGEEEAANGEAESEDQDGWAPASFKNPHLKKRFETARSLMAIGLTRLAKLELGEVERRTSNPGYLKLLMSAYQGLEGYNRSAYIGEINFGAARLRGLEKERPLWEFAYPQAWRQHVQKQARQLGLPEAMIWGIMRSESYYKPDVISPVGARGLMQLMPETAKQVARLNGETGFQIASLNDPETNIRLGSRYLQRLSQRFNRQLPLIAAAYNAGPHRAEGWVAGFGHRDTDEFIEHIPFLETRNYVKKVIKNYGVYQALYAKNPDELPWLKDPLQFKLSGRPSTREVWD